MSLEFKLHNLPEAQYFLTLFTLLYKLFFSYFYDMSASEQAFMIALGEYSYNYRLCVFTKQNQEKITSNYSDEFLHENK